jgi:hypothetical protein
LEVAVLRHLDAYGTFDSLDFCERHLGDKTQHQSLIGVLKSLESTETITQTSVKRAEWKVTTEGRNVIALGSPPARVHAALAAGPLTIAQLTDALGGDATLAKVGQGACMKRKWIKLDKAAGTLERAVDAIEDGQQSNLQKIAKGEDLDAKSMKELKKVRTTPSHLVSFGLIWSRLTFACLSLSPSLTVSPSHLVSFGLIWSHLVSSGLIWSHLVSSNIRMFESLTESHRVLPFLTIRPSRWCRKTTPRTP